MDEKATKVRTKAAILETLKDAINKSDRTLTKSMYRCSGSLVKNSYQSEKSPASYVGWLRLDNGELVRIEGEERKGVNGVTLSIKGVIIPNPLAVELDLDEPKIPDYKKDSFL